MIDPQKMKTAVVLLQLGGPDSLGAVRPFLRNIFLDPDIINFPLAFIARRPLANFLSSIRSRKVRDSYQQIGGRSPILALTELQAKALETALILKGMHAKVFIAMRYWHPTTEETVKKIKAGGFEQAMLLPLYPQFSTATTNSSINEWNRQVKIFDLNIPYRLVCCYPDHQGLVDAFVENINNTLERFIGIAEEDIDLIFSAHGVPISYINKGDPYQLQVEETVRCIIERGRWRSPHLLCYQSKVGPLKWLQPPLKETIEQLAEKKRRHLLIIPVSFVTEHIETLHEINIEVRRHATALGIFQFELMQALNDHPKFIECLTDLVIRQCSNPLDRRTCEILWQKNKERPKPLTCKNNQQK
jgi:ferrochelatase